MLTAAEGAPVTGGASYFCVGTVYTCDGPDSPLDLYAEWNHLFSVHPQRPRAVHRLQAHEQFKFHLLKNRGTGFTLLRF